MNPSFPTQHQQNLYNNIPPQLHQLTPLTNSLQGPPEAERPRRPLSPSTPSSQRRESDEARAKRLAENAERMRQKRAAESFEQYKARLAKNAEANRRRRLNESSEERQLRLAKGAARARLRWLNETPEQRAERNRLKADYLRMFRNSSPQDLTATRYALTHPAAAAAAAAASSTDNRIKAEHPPPPQIESLNTPNPAPIAPQPSNSALASAPPPTSAQNYPPSAVKGGGGHHPVVTNADFGAAFSTFFNHPQLKNGQLPPNAAAYGGPVAAYASQVYPQLPPELTVPMTTPTSATATYVKNERMAVPRPKNPSSRPPVQRAPSSSKTSAAAQKN